VWFGLKNATDVMTTPLHDTRYSDGNSFIVGSDTTTESLLHHQ